MKKLMIGLLALVAIGGGACSDDETTISVQPAASGSFTDERDGTEYHWVRLGGLDWMTENLRYVPETGNFAPDLTEPYLGYYDDGQDTLYYKLHGGLYDYETALAAVPEGWRLPTDEDWQALETALGMDAEELVTIGRRGSVQGELMQQGEEGTGLALELGGYYISDEDDARFMTIFTYESVYGFYWTATLDESKAEENFAYYRQIFYNSPQVERNSMTKLNLLSVLFLVLESFACYIW